MRQKKDIFKLEEYFLTNLFFKNLARDTDRETTYHCFKVMTLQTFSAGEKLFNYGTPFFSLLQVTSEPCSTSF